MMDIRALWRSAVEENYPWLLMLLTVIFGLVMFVVKVRVGG